MADHTNKSLMGEILKASQIGLSEVTFQGEPNFARWVNEKGFNFEEVMNFIASLNRSTLADIIPLNVDIMFEVMRGQKTTPIATQEAFEKSGPYMQAALGQAFMVGVIAALNKKS